MVKEFTEHNYAEFCLWRQAWGLNKIDLDCLPSYGLVVENVAMGFLILTDCNVGILDFFITHPLSEKKIRDDALDEIVNGLLKHGSELGLKNFKADTQIKAIKLRAEKFGFEYIGDYSNFFLKDYTWAV